MTRCGFILVGAVVLAGLIGAGCGRRGDVSAVGGPRDGLAVGVRPYLNMPSTWDAGGAAGAAAVRAAVGAGRVPKTLSRVGAFVDVRSLTPVAGLVEYDVNVPFWSDGAVKRRWIALPAGKTISFSPDQEWRFPAGTVFVKDFELPATKTAPAKRLETRVLVRDANGGVYGAAYKWRADGSDADLVTAPVTERVAGRAGEGGGKAWYYPGPLDCRTCHTQAHAGGGGGVLGVKTRQLNRVFGGRAGEREENELVAWQRRGMFGREVKIDPAALPRLAREDDRARSAEDRARSFLDVNCSNCHRGVGAEGGVAGNFDARYSTALGAQNLIDGPVLINLGIDHAKVISPGDVWRSIALVRVETMEGTKMPPLGHLVVDPAGAAVLREWIASLPGKAVLSPPVIVPRGGEFHGVVRVEIRAGGAATVDSGAQRAVIHYTLDGSLPVKSSPVYAGPIELTDPTTLRARAYKEGMKESIAVQETFIVEP